MSGLRDYGAEAGIGAPAADLGAIISGVGDVLFAFARALRPRERARLCDQLRLLVADVGSDEARATVPRQLLWVLEQRPAPLTRLRVISGGKAAAGGPRRPAPRGFD
jgi:hypothetical protein